MFPAATLCLVSLLAAEPSAVVAVTLLDGSVVEGQLTGWSDGQLAVVAEPQQQVINQADVLSVKLPHSDDPAPAPPCVIELLDGSKFPAEQVTVAGGRTSIQLDERFTTSTGPITLRARRVVSIQLGPLSDDAANDWDEIRALELPADVLVIRRGSTGRLDHLEGVVGEIDPTHVHFVLEGESIPVKREKVAGAIYYRSERDRAEQSVCVVHGEQEMTMHVARVAFEGDRFKLVSGAGVMLDVAPSALRWFDFSAGKLAYVSDLSPLAEEWTPLIGLPAAAKTAQQAGRPRRDESFFGSQLSLAFADDENRSPRERIETYNKGLAVRSRTQLTYRVPEDLERFVAIAGIDPEVRDQGHVQLVIEGDGQKLLDVEISGSDDPLPIDLPIGQVRRLTLLVDYGDNWDTGDLLNLCDAKFTK